MAAEYSVPSNFRSVVKDFTVDLSTTFPEYSYLWSKWSDPDASEDELKILFDYCLKVYPERFFDILYQNEKIFDADDVTNVYFLPKVSFRFLFSCEGLSANSKQALWKYLQIMLFCVVGGVKDKSTFGDAMNAFSGIDEKDLQEKMAETMSGIHDFFKNMEEAGSVPASAGPEAGADADTPFHEGFRNMFENMPNIQDHLKSLFDGKIGSLAKEMAEEISGDFSDILGTDATNLNSTNDVLKLLMKDPSRIKQLMKTLSTKLDDKMKSGEYSREELMREAGDLMHKMKDMGGQDQFMDMFKNMAQSMGKNMRMDTNAMDRMTKQASTRERLRKNMDLKRQQKEAEIEAQKQRAREQAAKQAKFSMNTAGENKFVFRLDGEDTQEKSFIHPDLLAEMEAPKAAATSSNKKKKNKK
jgi:Asp-tRNA(Asn)/Glu-tRNA(Gln) amidotransferase C subunit